MGLECVGLFAPVSPICPFPGTILPGAQAGTTSAGAPPPPPVLVKPASYVDNRARTFIFKRVTPDCVEVNFETNRRLGSLQDQAIMAELLGQRAARKMESKKAQQQANAKQRLKEERRLQQLEEQRLKSEAKGLKRQLHEQNEWLARDRKRRKKEVSISSLPSGPRV